MADGTLTFGKHKGKKYSWVLENDLEYFKWAAKNVRGGPLVPMLKYAQQTFKNMKAQHPERFPKKKKHRDDDDDIDTAVLKLLRRAGLDFLVSEKAKKLSDLESEAEAKSFDAGCAFAKFEANGYQSVEEMVKDNPELYAEMKGEAPVFLPPEEEAKPDVIDKTHSVYQYATAIIEVHRNILELKMLEDLDNDERKMVHKLGGFYSDLSVETFDRRKPDEKSKYSYVTIANMLNC
jgi:hypothetical protein